MSFFKSVYKLPIAAGHLSHRGLSRGLLVPPEHKRLPEVGPTHGEADEAWHSRRCRQPFAYLFVVFATPQDDAADFVATAPTRGRHNLRAVLAAVQPLDLPHVRLYLSVLELLDALDHKPRAQLQIVSLLVALKLFKLRLVRRYQQLEHKQAATLTMQVIRQPLQPSRLAAVYCLVALGVVAHQNLAERRSEGLDVLGEVLAVLEIELLLPALFGRAGGYVPPRRRVLKYGSTELLIDQDAGFLLGDSGRNNGLEAIVDHLFRGGDLCRLLCGQRALPAKHSGLERATVV